MTRGERGFALVEAILLGMVLLVPLLWALAVLDHVHRAALGSTTAAREAGFALGRSLDWRTSRETAERAVELALKDQDLDSASARVRLSTAGAPGRGERVHIEVRYPVPMAELPVIGRLPALWVSAGHDAVTDRYRTR